METDPDWTVDQRRQQEADEARINSWYERQRRRNQQHRCNQREKMWEAWERLGMLRSDTDVCTKSAEGKKIAPKKRPQPDRSRDSAKCAKTVQFNRNPVSENPTAASSGAATPFSPSSGYDTGRSASRSSSDGNLTSGSAVATALNCDAFCSAPTTTAVDSDLGGQKVSIATNH